MFRRLIGRLVARVAGLVVGVPGAFWFGSGVLVILPGRGMTALTREQARRLADQLASVLERSPKP